MTAPATVPEVLARAADIIQQRGWHQGWFIDRDTGAVCCVGAIRIAGGLTATPIYDRDAAAHDLVLNARSRMFGHLKRSVSVWNDEPGRTQAEVVAALRAAAEQVTP